MSSARLNAHIEAPVAAIWELVGDPRRHPEWWPRVVEVSGEEFDLGSEFVQVTRTPVGARRTTMAIDGVSALREIRMSCRMTGTYSAWRLTEAAGGTFLDAELGMEPVGLGNRAFDRLYGPIYFRRWLADSVDSLRRAVER